VVLLRAVQERRLIETERGRIAVGWLIVEDLAMVLALVMLPALGGVLSSSANESTTWTLVTRVALTLGKVAAFLALMLIVGRRLIPWVLNHVAGSGSRELFRLAVLTIALGVAFGAARLFDVSFALGAFFAGMVMSESPQSQEAAEESLPLRDAFAVLFFVSVGMLFDPMTLLRNPLPVVATVLIVLLGKSAASFLIVLAFRHPTTTALTISASLAQIGEFSFILANLGVHLHLLPEQGRDLILAVAMLSIIMNPFVFAGVDWIELRLARRTEGTVSPMAVDPGAVDDTRPSPTALKAHSIVVGYGRVGSVVGTALVARGEPFVVIEDSHSIVLRLRENGIEAFVGNGVRADILTAANVAEARQLFVAVPNPFESGQIVERARVLNPNLRIVARAHFESDVEHLTGVGADAVIMGEREIARGMIAHSFCPESSPAVSTTSEPERRP
jgi:CPA2 family monovalent cation:H+ antiporter-2